jgi:hypothetical protein
VKEKRASIKMSHIWDYGYRQKISAPLFRVVIEVFFFAVIGLILGLAITMLFPQFTTSETWYYSLGYLFLQLLVGAIVIYMFDKAYFLLFGVDSDSFIGITAFTHIFFLIQFTMLFRMLNVFTTYTQVELNRNIEIVHPGKRPVPAEAPRAPKQLGDYEYVAVS